MVVLDLKGFKCEVALKPRGTDATRGLVHNFSGCCKAPAGKQDFCKKCGTTLGKDTILKGVELTKGEVAYFSSEEIKSLKVAGEDAFKIEGKISVQDIEDAVITSSYTLLPAKKNEGRYAIIAGALGNTERRDARLGLVGKIVIRGSEHIGVLYATGNKHRTLRMDTLLFKTDERAYQIPEADAPDGLTEKMFSLVKAMPYADLASYTNGYEKRLLDAVEARLAGATIEIQAAPLSIGTEEEELERALAVVRTPSGSPSGPAGGQ